MSVSRDYKHAESRVHAGIDTTKFKMIVTAVDTNETVDDLQGEGRLAWMVKTDNGLGEDDRRGYFLSGVKMDGQGTIVLDVVVSPPVPGAFELPQIGDVVWVGVNASGRSSGLFYLHGDYAGSELLTHDADFNAPFWGGMPGDRGVLNSYQDHTMQFSRKPDKHYVPRLPQNKSTFITKWVRSITGYRWRKTVYENSSLKSELFPLRGDNVFEIDPENMGKEVVEEDGVQWLQLNTPQSKYPLPLNAPEKQEERPDFKFKYQVHQFQKDRPKKYSPFEQDTYTSVELTYKEYIVRNKNFVAHEPILDKSYKKRTAKTKWKGFERELPAVEEFVLALKGNNKLVIQDVHGDGEQIVLMLKSQYDEGLVIVHDKEKSQVRLRDHLGQSFLIEGDRDKPRIVAVTRERQVIEMGSKKDLGSFVYVRNGPAYGESDVDWGRKTGKTMGSVYNQEFALTSSKEISQDSEVLDRMSPGMQAIVAKGAGVHLRMANDALGIWEKTYSSWEVNDSDMFEETNQKYMQTSTVTKAEILSSGNSVNWESKAILSGSTLAFYKFSNDSLHFRKNVPFTETLQGEQIINSSGITVNTPLHWQLNAATASSVPIVGSGL